MQPFDAPPMAQTSARTGFSPTSQAAQDLKTIFRTITEQSCPHHYNFHMHTHCSDGKLSPEALMEQACSLELKGLAITDHHTVQGYQKACRWIENWRWTHPSSWSSRQSSGLPKLWAGIEITSEVMGVDVHILGYAFHIDHQAMRPYVQGGAPTGDDRQGQRVIQSIQAAGGMAVLAHPVRYRRSPEELIPAVAAFGIDGVETYYAYDRPAKWRPTPGKTERVKTLAITHELLSTCGTDSHGLKLTRRF